MSVPADLQAGQDRAEQPRRKIRIGDLLVQEKVISERQLHQALAEQKKSGHKLGNTLVELGFIGEQQLLEFLSRQLSIPLIDLSHQKIDPAVVQQLPEPLARRYRVILYRIDDHEAHIGIADPTDVFAFDAVARHLKKLVRLALVRESELLQALDQLYRATSEISSLAGQLDQELGSGELDLGSIVRDSDAAEAPVVRLLQTLFEDAIKIRASDIHIEPEEKVLRIRQRVDGVLQEQVMNEARIAGALVQRLKLLANLDIAEKRLPQDGRFQLKLKDRSVDVRLSTMPVHSGEAVVMRLLDQSSGILSLEQLGLEDVLRQRIERIIRRPHGLLLVTGPTGSGKTTTLYAALNALNTPERKIITVEDPIEYQLPRINQVQIHDQIGLTFARVLRTALRQDPDVVLVGEMRDLETAQIGLRAAVTGHFVLSTLHTNSAIGTVSRLLDMGAPGYLMATALQAVLAQRLVRRICRNCATDYTPDEHEAAWLASIGIDAAQRWKHGSGCSNCGDSGYRGRIGVYELLELQGDLLTSLRNEDIDAFARQAASAPGFESLSQHALSLARKGVTTLEEVMRVGGEQE